MDSGRLLLMRHGEKPADNTDPHLSPAGQARAQKLAQYIPATFGKPDFLIAAAVSKDSERPIETIAPLSEACGVPIDAKIADKDYARLAQDIASKPHFDGKLVVVCWHHGEIPALAQALGANAGDYPEPWDPVVFNLILQFDFTSGDPHVSQIVEPF